VHSGRAVSIRRDLSDEDESVGHGRSRYERPLVPSSWAAMRGETMRVGFIGLGAMGLPMTRHLLTAGHDVTVASRGRGPIDAAIAAGAREGDGPRGVVADSEVTVLCVPNSPEVVEVLDAGRTRARSRQDRRGYVDDRPGRRARAARARRGRGREIPRGAALGRHGRCRTRHAHTHGRRCGRRARGGASRARPVRRAHRARRRTGYGAGGEALQSAGVRGADARRRGGRDDGGEIGVDLGLLYEVLTHATGDCVALRTRLPFEGAIAESPRRTDGSPAS